MQKLLRVIDNINIWVGKIISFLIVIMTLIMVFEVVMRYIFNAPTIWSFETTTMLYGSYFMLVAGYTLLNNAHVSVDFIYERRTKRGKAIMDIISYLVFFFPFVIVILIEGYKYALESWMILEHSWSVFGPPLYPYKSIIPITAFLLLIQGLAVFIRNVQVLTQKEAGK
jgi:TRAP-type mannitol/chloroaromatic compound transport system permease small subunit